jgi:phosphoribosylamine--glycine ligase
MRVLVVGGGGREHALAWSLGRSSRVSEVLCAPGNAGTAHNRPVAVDDVKALVRLATEEAVDLVVVGPEAPLVAGLVDALGAAGVRAFGPSARCARLEGSKSHAKACMARWGVPTAASVTVSSYEEGLAALSRFEQPPVVKANGLAAGKGVIVPETWDDARSALATMLVDRVFGHAADETVLEERLVGREVSVLAVCSGTDHQLLVPAADHKRLCDGDTGPNTGGMGAYAPAPPVPDAVDLVFGPVLEGLAAAGTPYVGVLYAGLMLTESGPKVLEFNCRLGDPETQVVLPLLETDLADVIDAALDGELARQPLAWADGAACTVVMAAEGYPERPRRGDELRGLAEAAAEDRLVFHAGTARAAPARSNDPGPVLTAGGRVLSVTGLGADVPAAAEAAYRGVAEVSFAGMQYRRDIGRPTP